MTKITRRGFMQGLTEIVALTFISGGSPKKTNACNESNLKKEVIKLMERAHIDYLAVTSRSCDEGYKYNPFIVQMIPREKINITNIPISQLDKAADRLRDPHVEKLRNEVTELLKKSKYIMLRHERISNGEIGYESIDCRNIRQFDIPEEDLMCIKKTIQNWFPKCDYWNNKGVIYLGRQI